MTKCCDQLDTCYDTCGTSKYDCDSKFRSCLYGICSDLKTSLGFVSQVQGEVFANSRFFSGPFFLGTGNVSNSLLTHNIFSLCLLLLACDSMADVLYNTVWTLGCRPYMNSQRAACVCDGEERDEL